MVTYMSNTATTAAITNHTNRGDWTVGTINVNGEELEFQAKVYDEPSTYGINDGRISKLSIRSTNWGVVFNYDRGLDIDNMTPDTVDAIVAAIESL